LLNIPSVILQNGVHRCSPQFWQWKGTLLPVLHCLQGDASCITTAVLYSFVVKQQLLHDAATYFCTVSQKNWTRDTFLNNSDICGPTSIHIFYYRDSPCNVHLFSNGLHVLQSLLETDPAEYFFHQSRGHAEVWNLVSGYIRC